MDIGLLLVEMCMVGFCAILVFLAKRDLNAAALQQSAANAAESRELAETIEGLINVLEEKSQQIEARIQRRFDELTALEQQPGNQFRQSRGFMLDPAPQPERPALPVRNGFGDSWRSGNGPSQNDEMTPIARAVALVDGGANLQTAARIVGLSSLELETAIKARQMRRNRNAAENELEESRLSR